MEQLTLWSGGVPAKPSASQDSDNHSATTEETSRLSSCEPVTQSSQDGSCGKTSPEYSAPQEIPSGVFWQGLLGTIPLSNRLVVNGRAVGFCAPRTPKGTTARGAFSMLNTSVSPNDAKESSLWQVLEKTGGHLAKYSLSEKACAGILRRAEKRGKKLPPMLEKALREQCTCQGEETV